MYLLDQMLDAFHWNSPQIFPGILFGLQTGPAITFILFWLLNMWVVYLGWRALKITRLQKLSPSTCCFGSVVLGNLCREWIRTHPRATIQISIEQWVLENYFFPDLQAWLVSGQHFHQYPLTLPAMQKSESTDNRSGNRSSKSSMTLFSLSGCSGYFQQHLSFMEKLSGIHCTGRKIW